MATAATPTLWNSSNSNFGWGGGDFLVALTFRNSSVSAPTGGGEGFLTSLGGLTF